MAYNYIDTKNVMALPVNFARMWRGPLDASQIFNSATDLDLYCRFVDGYWSGLSTAEQTSIAGQFGEYWQTLIAANKLPVPHDGQFVATSINGVVTPYVLQLSSDGTKYDAIKLASAGAAGDLPVATTSTPGAVSVPTTGNLTVGSDGSLSVSQSLINSINGKQNTFPVYTDSGTIAKDFNSLYIKGSNGISASASGTEINIFIDQSTSDLISSIETKAETSEVEALRSSLDTLTSTVNSGFESLGTAAYRDAGNGPSEVLLLDNSGHVPSGNLNIATTNSAGIVQLSDSISSASTDKAATANAVKQVYDNVVHLTDDQTISGNKTFSDNVIADYLYTRNIATSDCDFININSGVLCYGNDQNFTKATDNTLITKGYVNEAIAAIPAIENASTSKAGIVKLNTATNSTSTTEAATPSAVKAAYDKAVTAQSKADTSVQLSGNQVITGEKSFADTIHASYIEGGNFNNYHGPVSISASTRINIKATDGVYFTNSSTQVFVNTPTADDHAANKKYVDDKFNGVADTLGTAATKDVGTAAGNVPELDGNGKLATSTLPDLAIMHTVVCTDATVKTEAQLVTWIKGQSANLQKGDVVIVNNGVEAVSGNYFLNKEPADIAAADLVKLYVPEMQEASLTINNKVYTTTNHAVDLGDYVTSITKDDHEYSTALLINQFVNNGTNQVTFGLTPGTQTRYGVVKIHQTYNENPNESTLITAFAQQGAYNMYTELTGAINGIKKTYNNDIIQFLSSDVSSTGSYTVTTDRQILSVILSNGVHAYPDIVKQGSGTYVLTFFDSTDDKDVVYDGAFSTAGNQHTIVLASTTIA